MSMKWLERISDKYGDAHVSVPSGYKTTRQWVPAIGDIVPNFDAKSTLGDLDFFQYAEGKWTYLFNHPTPGGAVCTTEIVELAEASEDFQHRDCQLLGLTQQSVEIETQWVNDVESYFPTKVWFPLVADPEFEISKLFGMTHWKENYLKAVRKTFLIDPSLKVAAILEYPLHTGRGVKEMLRLLDAQLEHVSRDVVTPVDWQAGSPPLVPTFMDKARARHKWGKQLRPVAPGVIYIDDPILEEDG